MANNFRFPIVGSNFHSGAKAKLAILGEGDRVALIRDPSNQYDRNAVRILSTDGQMLGHCPMDLSALVTEMLEREIIIDEGQIVVRKDMRLVAVYFNLDQGGVEPQIEDAPEGREYR
jgi:hypothetical protein